jgi:hypothetical protein
VKVGRTALDDEAMRLIEQLNPDVQFDWPRLLKGQGQPVSEPRVPHDVRRPRQDRRSQPRAPQAPPRLPPPVQPPAIGDDRRPDAGIEREAPAQEVVEAPPVVEIPPEYVAPALDDTPTPAHGRLGIDGVQRLRSRYADILRRIPDRIQDPMRREELRQQVERLNPDSWTSDDAVAQGLEQYEAVLASLKELVGLKRRRRRRGKGRSEPEGGSANERMSGEGGGGDERPGGPSPDDES